jgi:UDP-glucose 4-epimerase
MKCFVTGGAGFIGSHLVDRLIAEGNQVTIYDNFSSGRLEFIEQHLGQKTFKYVMADLLDFESIKKAVGGHDVVFHLSANPDARWGIENTRLDLEQETLATYNLLESMRLAKVNKIVMASSGTIYGETPVIPLTEDYGPVLPISLYGAGKVACEGLISAFCHTFGMQAWIYRFANIVGGRTTHGVIFDFINKLKKDQQVLEILGDGTQCKPYLHVKECVGGILFGLAHADEKVNVFNLGCDTATDVKTIAQMLVTEMGLKDVKFNFTGGDRGWPGDVPQVRYNVSRINNLGWHAGYSSDEAVRQAIKDIVGGKA